ncbi:MAG: isoprenyl transferase [Pseudomonadota bacterium]
MQDKKPSKQQSNSKKSPLRHIAIIMDGNGRWAQQHGYARIQGHRHGAKSVRTVIESAAKQQIEYLTLFCFSSENWQRPEHEINFLMELLIQYIKHELNNLIDNKIKLNVIGQTQKLPEKVYQILQQACEKTSKNTSLQLTLALNYGGRQDILKATHQIATLVKQNKLNIDSLNMREFTKYLSTAGMPDPDLLIRTSGERRISNFLLWQLAYSELVFIDKFWPDFTQQDFNDAIAIFNKRQRRFGNIS